MPLQLWEAVVLAVVQGFTEFLPVSSSGHLVLTSALLGVREATIAYDILVHFGTLLAVFVVLWPEIQQVASSALRLLVRPRRFWAERREIAAHRILLALVVGTLPAVVVALAFYQSLTGLFQQPYFAGAMLLVTGTILFVVERFPARQRSIGSVGLKDGLFVGCAQALAILPGISRSGTTISAGLLRGFERQSAARFSFLLTIPAILGGMVLAIRDLASGQVETAGSVLVIGVIVAALTGVLAIRMLLWIMRSGRLTWFSYYTWSMGTVIIVHWWLQR